MDKIELLAPAGDLEKLKIALIYGADAVYFGGENFSLRAGAGGLSFEDMKEGLTFAHEMGKKGYLTLNIYPHNEDIEPLKSFINKLNDLGFGNKESGYALDGILVSDPGVLMLVKTYLPNTDIHLSTQANLTNVESAKFWRSMGMKRLVLARELSLKEIREIRSELPQDTELEAFVHGAMCISYSGRCLLSSVMTGRDSNRGACAHPCRYKYNLVEEKRPGEYYPIEEDSRGTYIMNSKDLCMIENIPDLVEAGIASLKIEGRMKTIYYVACIIGAYRRAIDSFYESEDKDNWKLNPEIFDELTKASHREFTTGFYYGKTDSQDQNYETSAYIKDYSFVGIVKSFDEESSSAIIEQRNKFSVGEELEFFGPDGLCFTQTIEKMWDNSSMESIESAPHAQQIVRINTDHPLKPYYMLRRKEK